MAIIRVRSINPFHREDFLSRVYREMREFGPLLRGFPIGRSLSWHGFQIAATKADLAEICTLALDFREPHMRPDRKRFAAFRLSLGARLLERDLPFTRKQLCVLGDSLIMQLRTGNDAFPVERVSEIIKVRVEAL
ncbi:hypothetical protein [uncultured Algimonas sp.]|uniref:hypothetical protein n=1 Tax=uncultured Algimonas sp. TaxID=1547920 RepID=UPI002638637E|nr:hypothetical protein [uncultured Algimonas sp.]